MKKEKEIIANEGITCVLETNCYEKERDVGTVWILPGIHEESGPNKPGKDYYENEPLAEKVIGPIRYDVAKSVYERLLAIFKTYGFTAIGFLDIDD